MRKSSIYLLSLSAIFFLFSACANRQDAAILTPPEGSAETDTELEPTKRPDEKDGESYEFPYSLIAETYDIVLKALTEDYFSEYPDLDAEHTAKMQEFIKKEQPRALFVDQICEQYKAAFDRAVTDIPYRETEELQTNLDMAMNVAVPIAEGALSALRGVYVAKFVDKNPVKISLFEMEGSEDYSDLISWVQQEIPFEEIDKNLPFENAIQEGDRFFHFFSPSSMWEQLMGREGYLHVRDGKIIEGLVTVMN